MTLGVFGRAIHSLRTSFASRLLAAGLALAITLILSVSVVLLVSRDGQTSRAAQTNADNRAKVVRQLLQHVTSPQARYATRNLASLHVVEDALASPDPPARVSALFASGAAISLPNEDVVVFDAQGNVVFTTEPAAHRRITRELPALQAALRGQPAEGVEFASDANASLDFAQPIIAQGRVIGAVAYSAPLIRQLQVFDPIVGYPTAFVAAGNSARMVRSAKGQPVVGAAPRELAAALSTKPGKTSAPQAGDDVVDRRYVGADGDVWGSFVPLAGVGKGTIAGYVGVEIPLADFDKGKGQDELTVLLLGLAAMILTSWAVLVFVERFVRRPVARLERGVRRIAHGDYTSDIPVTSSDEFGRLGADVNLMRAQISRYIEHINGSVARLGEVSRALTTTTGGVGRLQSAVVAAAAGIAGTGGGSRVIVLSERGWEPQAQHGDIDVHHLLHKNSLDTLIRGESVRIDRQHALLAVPMFYQGAVVGALAVQTTSRPSQSDEEALSALANSGAIAMENTRLFEQERKTVRRLRELDTMKSDFLSTVQHELRTPVMAIMGQIELITVAWDQWDETTKKGLVDDMEVYTRQLNEIVETMIDFSLVSAETITLKPTSVRVGDTVAAAVGAIRSRTTGNLPVDVAVQVPDDLRAHADEKRLRQVIEALIDNAVKFTPAGGHVAIRGAVQGRQCQIVVEDDGIGIAPDALPRIFEQFFQADNSKTRTHGGMGMGLALAQRLVHAHGGSISADSVLGKGCRITVRWPSADATAKPSASSNGFHVPAPNGVRAAAPPMQNRQTADAE